MKSGFLVSLLALSSTVFAVEPRDPTKAYNLPEGAQYLSLKETNTGAITYKAEELKTVREKSDFEINHKKHTQWGPDTYLIWNFAPVGVGLQFYDDPDNNIAAEWEMDYRFREHLILNPKFTSKQKGVWSPLLGHELQLSYKYHYQNHPESSYWDIVLRGSVILNFLDNLRLGAFVAPEQFRLGAMSMPDQPIPFPYRTIYSTGLWTELLIRKTLALQVEGAVGFCEEREATFLAKYSVASTIGVYF